MSKNRQNLDMTGCSCVENVVFLPMTFTSCIEKRDFLYMITFSDIRFSLILCVTFLLHIRSIYTINLI